MTTKRLILAALLASAFAPALAEELDQQAEQPRVERRIVTRQGDGVAVHFDDSMGQAFSFDGFHVKPIKNAPYTAQVVTERQQTLSDGNQITNKRSSTSYRDSAGRTRQEIRDAKGELRTVTIHDPVAGATYVLHPRDKTATKVPTNPEQVRAAAEAARAAGEAARAKGGAQREEMRARIEQLRKEGKLPVVERRSGPDGEEIIVKRVERSGNGGGKEDVRVRVEQNFFDRAGGLPNQLAPLAGAFGDAKWSSKAATKDLGTREIDGVKAEGKLRTYEIPAGEVGNRNPIVVSHESWYSPDLQITLYTRHSDPRTGESVYRLEGLKRDEPAPSLFQVPADYTVRDVLANVKRRLEQKAPEAKTQ
jgi:hypothetical protein